MAAAGGQEREVRAGSGPLTVADVGEDGLVAGVIARYAPPPPGIVVGPGDDAAVLDVAASRVVVSTDTLVEGYDFRRDWSTARDVGRKTAAQNLADVAAMGAVPLALVVSLATPADLPVDWARELADGLAWECARAGASVAGGDVSQAAEIVVTGTAVGLLPGPAVLRSGARPGDVVALAGTTGGSAAGLALLLAGTEVAADPVLAGLVATHLAPTPPYPAGPAAARAGADALIDTSDGLLRDARRLAEASGVVLDLDPDALTPGPDLLAAAQALGDPSAAVDWVLTGGEDHCLLACFPPEATLPAEFRPIGRVRAADPDAGEPPAVLLGGRPCTGPDGWHHFS